MNAEGREGIGRRFVLFNMTTIVVFIFLVYVEACRTRKQKIRKMSIMESGASGVAEV